MIKDDLSATLAIRGIAKSFSVRDPGTGLMVPRKILHGVTFDIPAGKFVVLFGPNASGKTTLLKIIAGLESPNAGKILMPRSDMKIDMIFQNYRDSLYPWKTVLDNISFPLELQGISRLERRRAALKLLEKIGANILSGGEYKKYPYQLSGGQHQFIAFARSFLAQPDVLLLDESFAALDHDTRYLMQDVLTRVWEDTKFFVVFISHSVWEAVYMADIVVPLSKKPARVLNMVDIPLPRPRQREVEYSPEFFKLRSNILRVFEGELYGTSPRSP
jgi:NitT/TauT family transport system ATP-binding protein